MKKERYFKYRSLSGIGLKRFIDIIADEELYASPLKNLNDPMEGIVRFSKSVPMQDRTTFRQNYIEKCIVCSLSKKMREDEKPNGHMMAMYADDHRGCCIELEVTSHSSDLYKKTDWGKVEVNYSNSIPEISSVKENDFTTVISTKSPQWNEENEVRFVKFGESGKSLKLKIKIVKIMFGVKVTKKDVEKYTKIIKSFQPDVEVEHLKNSNVDYGFVF